MKIKIELEEYLINPPKKNEETKSNRQTTRAICHLLHFASQTAYVPGNVGFNPTTAGRIAIRGKMVSQALF